MIDLVKFDNWFKVCLHCQSRLSDEPFYEDWQFTYQTQECLHVSLAGTTFATVHSSSALFCSGAFL